MHRPTLFLIDRSRLFREGVKTLLTACDFEVSGEADTLAEAIEKLSGGPKPDLILIDLGGGDEQVEAVRKLRLADVAPRIVVMTKELSGGRLAQCLAAGAHGYLMMDMSGAALAQSLRLVLLGEIVFPTPLAQLLVDGGLDRMLALAPRAPVEGLTDRETQILTYLVEGMSNKAIAKCLELTEGTVKIHLKGLMRKLNVHSRTQAAMWALNMEAAVKTESSVRQH